MADNAQCGYCGSTDDVKNVIGVDYPICRQCRLDRGIDRKRAWKGVI